MSDDRVQAGSQPAGQQSNAPDRSNEVYLKRRIDPATMYFEVRDVIFEGESREVHEAEKVYQQALEEKDKVQSWCIAML